MATSRVEAERLAAANPGDQQGRIRFVNASRGDFLDNYKIPRSESGTCTMHNFNFMTLGIGARSSCPRRTREARRSSTVDALLSGASEGQSEIGYYRPHGSSAWSSYWYNGFMYANDIFRGVDLLLLSDEVIAGPGGCPS